MSKIMSAAMKYIKYGFDPALKLIGIIATVFTISGTSLKDLIPACYINCHLCERVVITLIAFAGLSLIMGWCSSLRYKGSVNLTIHSGNNVKICYGDIFKACGYKVIPCDTTFSTEADDKKISRKSLHGQFVLNHADKDKVIKTVRGAAKLSSGVPSFKTGTIIRYENPGEPNTYLMLALTELDDDNKAHTNMTEFIQTLLQMWREIDREYNGNDIVIPLLGSGITRFDDVFKNDPDKNLKLLSCMLYTLYISGVHFNNSTLKIVLGKGCNIHLHEVKDMFRKFA